MIMRTLSIAAVLILLSGCAVTGAANAKTDEGRVTLSQPIHVTPHADKTVYVSVSNVAMFQHVNPALRIRSRIVAAGYTIVSDPKKAAYEFSVFIHPIKPPHNRQATGRDVAVSTGIGAAVGSVFGSGNGKKAAILAGGALGAAIELNDNSGELSVTADLQITEKFRSQQLTHRGLQHRTQILIHRYVDDMSYAPQAGYFTDILAQTIADIMPR